MSSSSVSARVESLSSRQPNDLKAAIEAVLFASGKPVSIQRLAHVVGGHQEVARFMVERLRDQLEAAGRGIALSWDGECAELTVHPRYADVVAETHRTDVDRSIELIDEYLSVQRQRGRRPGTIKGYRQFMTRFARELGRPIDEATTRDIRRFLLREERDRGNSVSTIASKIHRLSSLYKWLAREEIIDRNPMDRIDAPVLPRSQPRYLTHEEIERARDATTKLFDRMLFELLYSSGIRREEAVNLDWSDVDLEGKSLLVREGKGGKDRTVPLSTRAVMLLRQYRAARKDSFPYVLRSQFDRRMSKESVNRRVTLMGKRAGLSSRLTPHRLRHSMAKHLRDAGMPLDVVQAILGHEDLRTTQIYSGLPESQIGQYYRAVFP